MGKSELEESLLTDIIAGGLPAPEREHRFHKTRKWRFDFAWPEHKIAAEAEGGIWTGGRHSRGLQFEKDCEKYNTATLEGWRVFRFTNNMIASGYAVGILEEVFKKIRG
jgi:very-short-patch-repair endonuclease